MSRFPSEESLCESCGYPVRGLSASQSCPECGRALAESDPERREGLAWQRGMGFSGWLATSWLMVRRPNRAWPMIRFDGPGAGWRVWGPDRAYLATVAGLVGLLWAVAWGGLGMPRPVYWGLGVFVGVVVFSYIEVGGVVFYSRRRGWRVTWGLTERLVCYLAMWWLPAAAFFLPLCVVQQRGELEGYWPSALGRWDLSKELLVMSGGWGLCIMGFEYLVWLGIRRVRFANWQPREVEVGGGLERGEERRGVTLGSDRGSVL